MGAGDAGDGSSAPRGAGGAAHPSSEDWDASSASSAGAGGTAGAVGGAGGSAGIGGVVSAGGAASDAGEGARRETGVDATAPLPPEQRVLRFLHQISGTKTVAGAHNREPSAAPTKWTDALFATTSRYPGLWSGDFLFQSDNIRDRGFMIDEAKRQWQKGALVNLMWHACPPNQDEPCGWDGGILSHLNDDAWTELVTDGSALNQTWKSRLDRLVPYLNDLQTNEVAVLFRPLHEMNQGAFWWGGRPGANGTRRLYRITHDYLTKAKGLHNLVWVWDVQDLSWDFSDYDPGPDYWDVVALDVYDGSGYTKKKYDAISAVAGTRPMAIGECQRLPTASELKAQPRWTFFMSWAELVYDYNSDEEIQSLYAVSNVLTRDEMPGWR